MLKIAFLLLVLSGTLLLGGGTYLLFKVVLTSPEVPLWAKAGFGAATLGLLLLLAAVVRDRVKSRRWDSFKEVEK